MLQQIGDIVSRVRAREGLSPDVLAQRAEVAESALIALEHGLPGLSTAALDRVASQLGLDGSALLAGQEVARPRVSVFLRHTGTQDFDHAAAAPLDQALESGRTLRSLNARLGRPATGRGDGTFRAHEATAQPERDGYACARSVRAWLNVPVDPLGDLRELLEERLEIAVVTAWLPRKLTAASVRDGSGAAAAVLNEWDEDRSANPQLARVHLAHELCHLLFDPSEGGVHLVCDVRDDNAKLIERAEKRARAFAAEFLLPLDGLTALLGPPLRERGAMKPRRMVAEARTHFSTPWEIAVNHLCNRKFVEPELRERLLREGPRGTVPGRIGTKLPPPDRPSIALRDRVRRAWDEGILTDGQVRVALGITLEQPLPWERRRAAG